MNHTHQPTLEHPARGALQAAKYGGIFTLLWLLLTKGNPNSWVIGVIVVPMATWCSVVLLKPNNADISIRIGGLIKLIPFFLQQSLRSGWDSALFALHPNKSVNPGFIQYQTTLPSGRPQLYFLHLISLLPGTASVQLNNSQLLIHTLDTNSNYQQDLRDCECRIHGLFGLAIDTEGNCK